MCIERILNSIEKYVDLKALAGDSHHFDEQMNAAKKEFASAMNQLIDFRVDAAVAEYKRNPNSNTEVIALTNALCSCPEPPNGEDLNEWIVQYKFWYENQRIAAICHKD